LHIGFGVDTSVIINTDVDDVRGGGKGKAQLIGCNRHDRLIPLVERMHDSHTPAGKGVDKQPGIQDLGPKQTWKVAQQQAHMIVVRQIEKLSSWVVNILSL
jgi:hypothetical protein